MKMKILITTMAFSAVSLGAGLLYNTSSSKAPEATFVLLDGSLRTANDFRGKVAADVSSGDERDELGSG